jgi:two-component system LytT family response regulator
MDPARFVQVHRSAIVNLERVREVQAWFGGDYIAILHGGEQVRVSRTHAPMLLRPAR